MYLVIVIIVFNRYPSTDLLFNLKLLLRFEYFLSKLESQPLNSL